VIQLDYLGKGEEVGWGAITFSPNGDLLASLHYEGSIKLYDMTTGKLFGELISNLGWIGSIAFSPDDKLIAVGGGNYDPRGIGVEIWDAATLEQKYVLENFDEPVLDLAFSPDGVLLATKDNNPWGCCYSVKLWNVKTRELLAELPVMQDFADLKDFAVYDITFTPDGTLLAVIHSDGKIELVDVASQKIVGKMTGIGGLGDAVTGLGYGVAISPDGNLLAASGTENTDAGKGDLRLWNLPNDQLVFRLVNHDVKVEGVAFNFDGTILISSNLLGCARLWDVRTGESLRVLDEAYVTNFTFSPDGTLLATKGQDKLIRIWGVPAH
jgi:dipeptidyl aminopeptidase/acylaminoacyl peptidase